ncbi:3'-phosphoadenosine 5'-phosphosulfate sulfotransferase (PAPS reductase)/FAD synthetase [Streptomyces sp. Ag109_O5-1]|uniref:phosphoadenosine phosphosulfate reductase n=1 Tax=Streptomyces sp. Ag109_O5-1 TaxID=1938851 RepID=UPI000F4F0EE0|nr:phosphoadenosine phosphosulfate reductase [Streptomyces sp. Ag109_O5-1]RPE40231.1 3'-phosphoadenosine 5'-phosphosulfate sulfotransferase (PAPS reductase)/FAD synthetase [Streptomyces sp. Ag109_O5-1]
MTTPTDADGVSFGGGQQSTALLVLAAQGKLPYRRFYFANVGADTEYPGTLRYVDEYAKPYAAQHGLEFIELRRVMQNGPDKGQERTLLQEIRRPGSRSIPFPMRVANGMPGTRACTETYKRRLVAKETRRRGASPEHPARLAIGISVDEIGRAKDSNIPHQTNVHPLLDLGLRRTDCQHIINAAGLPVPPKSACWFCPMKTPEQWRRMRQEEPALFAEACALEAEMIGRRAELGKDAMYMTRFGVPLAKAIPDGVDALPFFDEDQGCDDSACFT